MTTAVALNTQTSTTSFPPECAPFAPDSYPVMPGFARGGPSGYIRLQIKPEQIEVALQDLRLEDAKNYIYNLYGNKSQKTQLELLRIIEKIAQLNISHLSPEHEKLNYTLKAGNRLACHIHTLAINDKDTAPHYQYDIATLALQKIANAYVKQGKHHDAIRTLRTLEITLGHDLVQKVFIQPILEEMGKNTR